MRKLGFIPFILGAAIAGIGGAFLNSNIIMWVGIAISAGSLAYLILNDAKKH